MIGKRSLILCLLLALVMGVVSWGVHTFRRDARRQMRQAQAKRLVDVIEKDWAGVINAAQARKRDAMLAARVATLIRKGAVVNGRAPSMRYVNTNARHVNENEHPEITPLHAACGKYGPSTVQTLITAGADVNATDSDGQTPLMWAVQRSGVDTVKVLIRAGANVNARDQWGRTALSLTPQGTDEFGTWMEGKQIARELRRAGAIK